MCTKDNIELFNRKIKLKIKHPKKVIQLTCVWDERQLFGPYLDSLLSGSANRYSPSEMNINAFVVLIID